MMSRIKAHCTKLMQLLGKINIKPHIPSTSNAASNQSTLHQANAIIRKDKYKTELAQYLHAAAVYPVLSTFIQAIKKGNFLSWPGIGSISFKKHLP